MGKRMKTLMTMMGVAGLLGTALVAPQLWAHQAEPAPSSARLTGAFEAGGARSVMMMEHKQSAVHGPKSAPVAASIEVEAASDGESDTVVSVVFLDHRRDELARGEAHVGDDGRVLIETSREVESPRPWWQCRVLDGTSCQSFAVERTTLALAAELDDDGVLLVHSLTTGSARLTRERVGAELHDSTARWLRYELPGTVAVPLVLGI